MPGKPMLHALHRTPTPQPDKIGSLLLQAGLITDDQLRIALEDQRQHPALLGEVCVRLGFLADDDLTAILAARSGLPIIAAQQLRPDPALLSHWPQQLAARYCALPVRLEQDTLHLALADPYDVLAQDAARQSFPSCRQLQCWLAPTQALRQSIADYYGQDGALDQVLLELQQPDKADAAGHPIIRLVDGLIAEAVRRGASDIHLEPENTFIRIRYRVDGLLQQTRALHKTLWPALSHRIKIMAGMNIAETRRIQDGSFRQQHGGATIDFRVALMPTVQGENIVIRVLDHRRALVSLAELGFDANAQQLIAAMMARPQGLTLITGPTGSGKTTTLYALLRSINDQSVKIATLEQPVEYQLDLIRQTAIDEQLGLSFAAGVRGVLRMDPDIILVGEIRDSETAQMALRAAITGHKVLATLHSHDGLSALTRLVDLGLSPALLAGNLCGIMAQRLVGLLCPHCKQPSLADSATSHLLGFDPVNPPWLYDAAGCTACHGSGIMGRSVIAELLPIDDGLDDLIADQAPRAALRRHIAAQHYPSLRDHGLARLLAGEISLRALRRVIAL